MKIRVWFHIQDGGDGSVSLHPYKTEAEAERAAEQEMEDCGGGLDENVTYEDFDTDDYEKIE